MFFSMQIYLDKYINKERFKKYIGFIFFFKCMHIIFQITCIYLSEILLKHVVTYLLNTLEMTLIPFIHTHIHIWNIFHPHIYTYLLTTSTLVTFTSELNSFLL